MHPYLTEEQQQIFGGWCVDFLKLNIHLGYRRYLATLLKAFAEKLLITDDLIAEKLSQRSCREGFNNDIEKRLTKLEQKYREREGPIKN